MKGWGVWWHEWYLIRFLRVGFGHGVLDLARTVLRGDFSPTWLFKPH